MRLSPHNIKRPFSVLLVLSRWSVPATLGSLSLSTLPLSRRPMPLICISLHTNAAEQACSAS